MILSNAPETEKFGFKLKTEKKANFFFIFQQNFSDGIVAFCFQAGKLRQKPTLSESNFYSPHFPLQKKKKNKSTKARLWKNFSFVNYLEFSSQRSNAPLMEKIKKKKSRNLFRSGSESGSQSRVISKVLITYTYGFRGGGEGRGGGLRNDSNR